VARPVAAHLDDTGVPLMESEKGLNYLFTV